MTIADAIAKAEREAAAHSAEAERLRKLVAAYPDVREHVGRWNKVTFCSRSVNASVDRFDMRHNCGCCDDSPLEIWPYVETPLGKVYSDPPVFMVGQRDSFAGGDRPYPDWETKMSDAGTPQSIVDAVSAHFQRCEEQADNGDDDA